MSRWQGWSNIAVNPRFLVGVDPDCLVGTTSSIHFLMKHVTVSEYASMSSPDAARNMSQSTWSKQSCSISVRLVRPTMNCPESGCFTFQFLPISRQEQNGRVIRFAERWAGEGLVCVPEGGVTVVECAISTRVDGDVLKVFWSYCFEVGFIKVPRDNKSCIWVRGFLLTYIPVQFLECLVCVGLGGGYKQPWLWSL